MSWEGRGVGYRLGDWIKGGGHYTLLRAMHKQKKKGGFSTRRVKGKGGMNEGESGSLSLNLEEFTKKLLFKLYKKISIEFSSLEKFKFRKF